MIIEQGVFVGVKGSVAGGRGCGFGVGGAGGALLALASRRMLRIWLMMSARLSGRPGEEDDKLVEDMDIVGGKRGHHRRFIPTFERSFSRKWRGGRKSTFLSIPDFPGTSCVNLCSS